MSSHSLFKVGDHVQCVNPAPLHLIEGRIYVCRAPENFGYVSVEGVFGAWYDDRFTNVEPVVSNVIKDESLPLCTRLEKLEKQMEKVIECIKKWDSMGFNDRADFIEGLNWEALQVEEPEKTRPKSKRKIIIDLNA